MRAPQNLPNLHLSLDTAATRSLQNTPHTPPSLLWLNVSASHWREEETRKRKRVKKSAVLSPLLHPPRPAGSKPLALPLPALRLAEGTSERPPSGSSYSRMRITCYRSRASGTS